MSWFNRPTPQYITIDPPAKRERIGKDVWHKCDHCGTIVRNKDWIQNWRVCPSCNTHDRLEVFERINLMIDSGSFEETETQLVSADPLGFVDSKKYTERVEQARAKTGRNDAVVTGRAKIYDVPVALAAMDFDFMGGSMGSVVGEKIARAMELAIAENRVCITVAATGGARMQEGILSLMQLAKTSILCKRMQEKGIPFISILADPSTAGVMASFASLGDIIISEPGAYVGFAGRRVIEQTIRQSLPKGFQTAEFVRDHGFIDLVIPRSEMRSTLGTLLRQIKRLPALENPSANSNGEG
ncbi:MAG: acetyl-CoA carboxylase, carboxyltransferase subunit beta [Candidatus Sumerlaeia bacterium]|nr:acetyl-CoA carboxylase, carboxyltransferase subunit beta [Candidatus Sumerlaeia bacterium]